MTPRPGASDPPFTAFVVPQWQQIVVGAGVAAERYFYRLQAFFNALRDANFALASEQLHGAHLAHVHAHRIGGAAELSVEICERRAGRFLDRFLTRSGQNVHPVCSSNDSASGAFSYTGMPMSLIMLTMSSICSGSTISLGK